MKSLLIFISGPFTATTDDGVIENVLRATEVGIAIMRKGHRSFIPHLSYMTDEYAKTQNEGGFPYETWLGQDLAILERCDAMLFIGHSKGADRELARAKELEIPIFYSIEEISELN
jgi:hypothetical protein